MAYIESWSTKEEVLKDLARASGRRIKKNNIDEGYLVIGDAPPPAIPEDEDAEMQLLFGEAASRKSVPEEDATPDLAGIQQMLRMMKDFNDGDDDDMNQDNSKECVIAISKVSKLNPNVPEFIPSSSSSTSKSSKDINSNIVVTQTAHEESSKDTKVSDINKDLEKETQDIAITLKNQISEAAKSDSFEVKKQKNVAIATLLRLYANANSSPTKNAAPLKLLTPEYYEGKKESNSNAVEAQVNVISPSTSSATPEPRESSTTLPSTLSTSTGSTTPFERSPKLIDPEIKKSIDKVNRWLEEPSKRKSPAVCLGPIAFKRKEPNNCKSPVSDTAPRTTKSSGDSKQYRPSKYAADLGKQYLERSKALESKQKDVTWTNLEEKLKEKDLIIKKRLEEQAASDS